MSKLAQVLTTVEALYEKVMDFAQTNREMIASGSSSSSPFDVDYAERSILTELLAIGALLMDDFLESSGPGDVGVTTVFDGRTYRRHSTISTRELDSVFGKLDYRFQKYFCDDSSATTNFSPMRSTLNFPERKASYLVQDFLCRMAVDRPFDEASEFFRDIFGTRHSKRTIDDLIMEQARHTDSFEKARNPDPDESADILVVSFDGKGVPMHKESRLSADGTKRMSMIGVDYEVDRNVRTPKEMVQALTSSLLPELETIVEKQEREEKVTPKAVGKHYQAALEDKDRVFEHVKRSAERRRSADQPLVVLTDAGRDVRGKAINCFPHADAHVVDVVHPLGYLGDAAKALYGPKKCKPHLGAYVSVLLHYGRDGAKMLAEELNDEVGKRRLKKESKEKVRAAITYFRNNADGMCYDEYLAKGYPIATGVVESACGMLVCDRMEFAGARWQLKPAEAMLEMRALKKSDDWSAYREHRKQQEYLRLYARAS